jgi:hypothetical protein
MGNDTGDKRFVIVVPARFWDDHRERETEEEIMRHGNLPESILSRELGTTSAGVKVDISERMLDELISDATYYAEEMDAAYCPLGLILSARATLRRLEKQGFAI